MKALVYTFNQEKALVGAFSIIVKPSRRFVPSSSVLAAAGAVLVIVTVLKFEAGGRREGRTGGGMVPVYNVLFWPNYKVIRIGPRMLHSTPPLTTQHSTTSWIRTPHCYRISPTPATAECGWQSNIQPPKGLLISSSSKLF